MVLVDILREVSFEEQYGSEFEWKCRTSERGLIEKVNKRTSECWWWWW